MADASQPTAAKLHADQAPAAEGSRIAFHFDKQAWFPVNGRESGGSVTAILKADTIYDKKHGMRSRAIAFELEHGDGDHEEAAAQSAE